MVRVGRVHLGIDVIQRRADRHQHIRTDIGEQAKSREIVAALIDGQSVREQTEPKRRHRPEATPSLGGQEPVAGLLVVGGLIIQIEGWEQAALADGAGSCRPRSHCPAEHPLFVGDARGQAVEVVAGHAEPGPGPATDGDGQTGAGHVDLVGVEPGRAAGGDGKDRGAECVRSDAERGSDDQVRGCFHGCASAPRVPRAHAVPNES